MAVLGSMLIEEDAIAHAIEFLTPDAFYKDAHKKIFQCVLNLFNENKAVDLLTLTDNLEKEGMLEAVGGPSVLAHLTTVVPTAANILYYAKIVKEKHILRHLIHSSTQIVTDCYDTTQDVDVLLDRAEKAIFDIASRKFSGGVVLLKDIIRDQIEVIDKLYQRKEHITGLATGFHEFDTQTAGLQPSDLIIIAGRPSMGKSAFMTCVAEHVGMVLKQPTAIFSLEMSKEQLIQRMLCSSARINAHKVRTGFFAESDWTILTRAASKLSEAPIYIDDTPGISVLELKAKARRLKAQYGIKLLILDYLQLMRGTPGSESRQQEISEISRSLKELARELNVPLIGISQLSRAVESRTDHRPQLSDLRECVVEDTLVTLADGRRIPIAELEGQTPEVLAVTPEGYITRAKSDKVWRVGIKPVVKVRLASGRFITVTREHRLFGPDGWVQAGSLQVGDRLAIVRTEAQAHFLGKAGAFGPRARQARVLEPLLQGIVSNTNVDTLPNEFFSRVKTLMKSQGISQRRMAVLRGTSYGGSSHFSFAPSRTMIAEYATLLKDPELQNQAQNDLFWDRVVSVEVAGQAEVFDLTVPGLSCWLADSIVSHNSGAIEQDADVVVLLLREEYYNPTEENKGKAEVIIAKQRNGPVGSINLTFIREYTRFENAELMRREEMH